MIVQLITLIQTLYRHGRNARSNKVTARNTATIFILVLNLHCAYTFSCTKK